MKKTALTLIFVLAAVNTAFAYYEENTMQDIDILRAQGYSESTIQVVDVVSSHNKGEGGRFSRKYTLKKGKNALGRSYTAIKNYIDPIQDDGIFGEHQIQFVNTWNDDLPEYANRFNTDYNVENL